MNERSNTRSEFEDDQVRQAYRALPDDEVPAALDQRVIEAAKAALVSRRKPLWRRWSAPLALAASFVVVIAIVLDPGARNTVDVKRAPRAIASAAKVESEPAAAPLRTPAVPSQSFADEGARGQSIPEARGEQKTEAPARASEDVIVTGQHGQAPMWEAPVAAPALPQMEQHAPSAPLPAPPPPAVEPAPAQRADASTATTENRVAAPSAGEAKEAAAETTMAARRVPATFTNSLSKSRVQTTTAAAATRDRDAAQTPSSVEEIAVTAAARDPKMTQWLEKIHTLQSKGQHTRAAREIKQFKRAYPDVDVEEALEDLRRSGGE